MPAYGRAENFRKICVEFYLFKSLCVFDTYSSLVCLEL